MNQKCKICGAPLEGYETFCPGCGSELPGSKGAGYRADTGLAEDNYAMEFVSSPARRAENGRRAEPQVPSFLRKRKTEIIEEEPDFEDLIEFPVEDWSDIEPDETEEYEEYFEVDGDDYDSADTDDDEPTALPDFDSIFRIDRKKDDAPHFVPRERHSERMQLGKPGTGRALPSSKLARRRDERPATHRSPRRPADRRPDVRSSYRPSRRRPVSRYQQRLRRQQQLRLAKRLLAVLAGVAAIALLITGVRALFGEKTEYPFSGVLDTYFTAVRTGNANTFIATRPDDFIRYLTTGSGSKYENESDYRAQMAAELQQRLADYQAMYGDIKSITYELTSVMRYEHRCEALSGVLTGWYHFPENAVTDAYIVDGAYTIKGSKGFGDAEINDLLLIQIGGEWYFSPDAGSYWRAD